MKKHFNFIMIAVVAVSLLAAKCGTDPDDPPSDGGTTTFDDPSVIIAKDVINSNPDIVSVKAVMYNEETDEEKVIATGKYENNGFKITLPKTISNEYLFDADEAFGDEQGIVISDPNAKIGVAWVYAFNDKGKEIGDFYCLGITTKYYVDAMYVYADRNFTIKGKIEEGKYVDEYDCSFKKGWNILYAIDGNFEYFFLLSTQKPADINMEWIFEESYSWESAYVRFVKEIDSPDCKAMGVMHEDFGIQAMCYFWDESGASSYYWIPVGNYAIIHLDEDYNQVVDISGYYFEDEGIYSVVCSEKDGELYFYVTQDGKSNKSIKQKSLLKKHTTIAKRRALQD